MRRATLFFVLMVSAALLLTGSCAFAASGSATLPAAATAIEENAFFGAASLQEVIIPEGTTTIGSMAFANSGITEITLPDSLESIAADAFSGCEKLEVIHASQKLMASLDIPSLFADTPWLIASGACDEQISWHFVADGTLYLAGNGVLHIETQPWGQYLQQITRLHIGNGITGINGPAFSGCSAMTECHLPDTLKEIRNDTFRECTGLASLSFPSGMETIGPYAFYGCTHLQDVTLNQGLKAIEDSAFMHNYSLQTLLLPQSLQHLDATAFYASSSLEQLDVMPGNPYFTAVDGVIYSADMKTLVLFPRAYSDVFSIPDGVTEIGPCAFQSSRVRDVLFPDSMAVIGQKAFSDCRNITILTLGNNVTTLRKQAFETCTELTTIHFPATLEVIESSVFIDCYSLAAIHVAEGNTHYSSSNGILMADNGTVLMFCPVQYSGRFVCPAGVLSIADGAFTACNAITEIFLPDGLKTIGKGAFNRCSATTIHLPGTLESIGQDAFSSSELTSIVVPKSVKEMGYSIFSSCFNLKDVVLEEGLQMISYGTFSHCSALESLQIPSSITSIGNFAFFQCPSLTAIHVSDANQSYASVEGVLFNKSGTTLIHYPAGRSESSYTLPNGTEKISSYAFDCCNALEHIVLPESVHRIGLEAVHQCTRLQFIKFMGTQDQWNRNTIFEEEGNWIYGYDPQQFIDFFNSLVVFD